MIGLYTAKEQKAWDQRTRDVRSWSTGQLIQHAGRCLYVALLATCRIPIRGGVCVLVGPGHNGDDGIVIATHLADAGHQVSILLDTTATSTSLRQELLTAVEGAGAAVHPVADFDEISKTIRPTLVIDALFGIGLTRPLEGYYARLVTSVNTYRSVQPAEIVAIDVPSGVSWTNDEMPIAILADRTLVVEQPDLGALLPYHRHCYGRAYRVLIGLTPDYPSTHPSDHQWIDPVLDAIGHASHVQVYGHKHKHGRVGILAGTTGMIGAAILSCQAAMSSGAGTVYAHLPVEGHVPMLVHAPEVMHRPCDIAALSSAFHPDTTGYDAMLVGPGLGDTLDDSILDHFMESSAERPVIFDADALNQLAKSPTRLQQLGAQAILTPHVGEFHRLFGTYAQIKDRWKKAVEMSQHLGIHIVLKDAHTIICDADGASYYHPVANPALAVAGSGDVLAGTIAGYAAMGLDPLDAAISGVASHGLAGGLLRTTHGARGGRASDLVHYLSTIRAWLPRLQARHSDLPYPPLWLTVEDFDDIIQHIYVPI